MGYGPIKATVGPALEMLYQPWIRGEENIPTEGAAILASNHLAVIDSFFLPLLVDREVAFIGKADYFTGKGVKGWAVKNLHEDRRHHPRGPLRRQGLPGGASGRHRPPALGAALRHLPRGHAQPRWAPLPRQDRRGPHRPGHPEPPWCPWP